MNHRIKAHEHTSRPWIVHDLLGEDFEIEDVWRIPVLLEPAHTLEIFREQFRIAMTRLMHSGVTGKLFELRFFLGRVFGWENASETEAANPQSPPAGSLRKRFVDSKNYSANRASASLESIDDNFSTVYALSDEYLAELENATVHAALHLSRVPETELPEKCTIHLTVYVKPKGVFGRTYMQMITPFRLWVVYPAIMNGIKLHWELYLSSGR